MRAFFCGCAAGATLLAVFTAGAAAAGGERDPSFATAGVASINTTALAVQSDGRFVHTNGGTLMRRLPSGGLDTSFAATSFDQFGDYHVYQRVALAPAGKVVGAGQIQQSATAFVTRVLADGTADTTFGRGGEARLDQPGTTVNDLAVLADGRVVAVGSHRDECNSFGSCFRSGYVAMLTAGGLLDTAFGGGDGWLSLDFDPAEANEDVWGVAIDSTGRLLLAGSRPGDGFLARLHSDGSTDATFGASGFVFGGMTASNGYRDVALDAGGRIFVLGDNDVVSGTGTRKALLVLRLLSDGAPDISFGTGGGTTVSGEQGFRAAAGNMLYLDAEGKIVAGGNWRTAANTDDVAFVRLTAEGALDLSFSGDGIVIDNLGRGDELTALAAQEGRILAAVRHLDGETSYDVTGSVVRYLSGSESPPPALSVTAPALVTEGNTGTTPATFTISLSGPAVCDTTVQYTTVDGTASAPSDYAATSGTATILAGSTSTTVSVPVSGDNAAEGDETFSLGLSAPTCAVLGSSSSASATIMNDDYAPTLIAVAPAPGSTGVARTAVVSATFDRPLTSYSLTLQSVGRNLRTVRGTVSCTSSCTVVVFTPSRPLRSGRTYEATVTGTNATGSSAPFVWRFST